MHRGPDGIKTYQSSDLAFVHCLLRTTPEEFYEKQPLRDKETGIIITADARIDNRKELLNKLRTFNEKNEKIPDSRIIIEAYKKWGEDCAIHLIGDFAFVLWDPHLRKLFCARDHIGSRPFYYYSSEKIFAFASEIKSIFALQTVPRSINESRVADYLQLLSGNNTDTFYKHIVRLAPASFLVINDGKRVIHKYWDYNYEATTKGADNDTYSQEFKEIFVEAVQCRLRTVSPLGCTMSGGLDSSSVVCVANRALSTYGRLSTFSYNFPLLAKEQLKLIDERRYQEAVLKNGNFDHHDIIGHEHDPLINLTEHLDSYDQPFFYPHLYLDWHAWSVAKETGIRVMLNGLDGDSVVSHGYEYLHDLILRGRFDLFGKNIKQLSRTLNVPVKQLIKRYLIRPYFLAPIKDTYFYLNSKFRPATLVSKILKKDFAMSTGLVSRLQPDFSSFRSARQIHYQRLTNPLLTSALESINVFASRFQVEMRSPFFDRRIMEFCFKLPPDQKLQNGWNRFVLREAMKDIIPSEVFLRVGKSNLSPGFIHTFLSKNLKIVENAIKTPAPRLSEMIDTKELARQFAFFLKNPYTCNRLFHLNLYSVVVLNGWYEKLRLS